MVCDWRKEVNLEASVCQQNVKEEIVCGFSELEKKDRWKMFAPKFECKLSQIHKLVTGALKSLLKEFGDVFNVDKNVVLQIW